MRIRGVDLGKLSEAIDGVPAMEMQQVIYFQALRGVELHSGSAPL
jgi:hypothetical protein